jgi:hypothetical protein
LKFGFVLPKTGSGWKARIQISNFATLSIELFGCFKTPALAETRARATAIFVDEFDAGGFKCTPYNFEGGSARFANASFKLVHCYDANARLFSQVLLTPGQEATRSPALFWGNHKREGAKAKRFSQFHINFIDRLKHIIFTIT